MSNVLVTGASGFIAGHCILHLLSDGHTVRGTLRSPGREAKIRAALAAAGANHRALNRLTFVSARLDSDAGWSEAVAGCDHVLHIASPFPAGVPAHEDDLIRPAREGALRVLRAARDAGVSRVVLTSSFAAIAYGHASRLRPFDESDWTDTNAPGLAAYPKSKTLAERAAWDFIDAEGGDLELAVINPVGVFGPVLDTNLSTSVEAVKRMLRGGIPLCPRLWFGLVDVRDVADLHLLAMTHPKAAGERFIAAAGEAMSLTEVAKTLKRRLGDDAERVSTLEAPDWLVRGMGRTNPMARSIVPELGKIKQASHDKASRILAWRPRSNEEALIATADSLVRLGLAGKRRPVLRTPIRALARA
jgi:dihydroflavonol-4-reductase